jgi:hypothetical protein
MCPNVIPNNFFVLHRIEHVEAFPALLRGDPLRQRRMTSGLGRFCDHVAVSVIPITFEHRSRLSQVRLHAAGMPTRPGLESIDNSVLHLFRLRKSPPIIISQRIEQVLLPAVEFCSYR